MNHERVMVPVNCAFSQYTWLLKNLYWIPTSRFLCYVLRQGTVTKGNNYVITLHCSSSYCAWPLYEVVLNSNHYFSSYPPDNWKYQKAITLDYSKWSYGSSALHFLSMCLNIEWSCIEFQLVVFKLFSEQEKEIEK
jgi:hypothetical protein